MARRLEASIRKLRLMADNEITLEAKTFSEALDISEDYPGVTILFTITQEDGFDQIYVTHNMANKKLTPKQEKFCREYSEHLTVSNAWFLSEL